MSLYLKSEQRDNLALLQQRPLEDVVELCKFAFDYLTNDKTNNLQRYENYARKCNSNVETVQCAVEALISLLIDATKANATEADMRQLNQEGTFTPEVLDILTQFVTADKKRNFVQGSIVTANIRAYRLVNIEWRLEVRVASRALLHQTNIAVVMKLYLHTEPKNENRDLLEVGRQEPIHPDERRNRKDILVQTDLNSLGYIIQSLEDALLESKSRRIRNIVDAIH